MKKNLLVLPEQNEIVEFDESTSTAIKAINQANFLLSQARTIEETLDVRAKIIAVEAFIKAANVRVKGAEKAIAEAQKVKLSAERKIGGLIPKAETVGASQDNVSRRNILDEHGISSVEATRYQKMADIPEPEFNQLLVDSPKVTQSAILSQAKIIQNAKALNQKKSSYIAKAKSITLSRDLADFRVGDFRTQLQELRNVDLILADPPYPEEFVPLYGDLARFASVSLREGGSLVTMLGHDHLPEVLDELKNGSSDGLHYHSVLAQLHRLDRTASDFPARTLHAWKPLFWFVKGKYLGDWHEDLIKAGDLEKDLDSWQQSVASAEPIIQNYSRPGDLVVDPMAGWGTFGLASVKLKRRFIGCELEIEKVNISIGRLQEMIEANQA